MPFMKTVIPVILVFDFNIPEISYRGNPVFSSEEFGVFQTKNGTVNDCLVGTVIWAVL
jgi:hypothetical protein